MRRPEKSHQPECLVPPAAQLNAAAGIFCVIFGIAATTLSWLCFETYSPAIAVGCGVATGGLLFLTDHWRRRRFGPPTLRWNASAVSVEQAGQRTIIPWSDLTEIRHIDADIEALEFHPGPAREPILIVLDHFSREQAEEIRRQLGI